MSGKFSMDDYVPVNERIDQFYRSHPEGSIQSEIVELTASRVTVKAYAYRTPDDPRPGVGHSSLEIPGSTPYTRGSEIENAETSAWGRAIAALGFEVKRGVASREEVRNKQPERAAGGAPASSPNRSSAQASYRRDELMGLMREKGLDLDAVERYAAIVGIPPGQRATNEQMDALIDAVRGHGSDEPIEPPLAREGGPESAPPVDEPEAELPPASGPPPRPGTEEYRSLATSAERASARAWWAEHERQDQQETLAEALGAPTA